MKKDSKEKFNDDTGGLLTDEEYQKAISIYKKIDKKDLYKISNIGLINIAHNVGYQGSLIDKHGRFLWDNCIDMLCDLYLCSTEEAYLYIIIHFPSRLENLSKFY